VKADEYNKSRAKMQWATEAEADHEAYISIHSQELGLNPENTREVTNVGMT
jgi:hypothetical protein